MRLSHRVESRSFRKPSAANLAAGPLLVFYEVTQACDLVCQHCRACAQPRADAGELTPDQSRQLIDQLTEFPVPPRLILTGGDPLKRADIFELIRYGADRGLDVAITPSATPLVTADAIRRMQEAGISRLAVSIDGADAATHDANRGVAGSFERSLEILMLAREAGVPTQVNTTLTPANLGQLDRFADLLAGAGIALWSVFFLVPVGRAKGAPRLSAEQYEAAFARLYRHAGVLPFAIKTTEAPHYRRFAIQSRKSQGDAGPPQVGPPQIGPPQVGPPNAAPRIESYGVNDGKGVMFVGHTGLIHPSGFLPAPCGRFPDQHVVRVYQDHPVFRALRDPDRLEGKCRACEFRAICGGSRARAFAVTGNFLAAEPDCSYLPAALSSSS